MSSTTEMQKDPQILRNDFWDYAQLILNDKKNQDDIVSSNLNLLVFYVLIYIRK